MAKRSAWVKRATATASQMERALHQKEKMIAREIISSVRSKVQAATRDGRRTTEVMYVYHDGEANISNISRFVQKEVEKYCRVVGLKTSWQHRDRRRDSDARSQVLEVSW